MIDWDILLFMVIGGGLAYLFVCFVFIPGFWQGWRNTKFIDKLKKEKEREQKKSGKKSGQTNSLIEP